MMEQVDSAKRLIAGTIFAIDDIFREICKTLDTYSLLRLQRTCRHFLSFVASLWPVIASDRGVIVEKSENGTYGINTKMYEQFDDILWDRALFYKEARASTCWHKFLLSPSHYREMQSKSSQCQECTQTSSLWRCLAPGCGYIGCSRYANQHALNHSHSNKGHYLASCGQIWCYGCEKYIRDVF
jgi:hypothetical protein